ncbi:hypothetical protein S7711_08820 [Stachybotrys chartarum IBT 7711]|uniref:Histone-lysine N-methyltransferase n=1 Tax=Stachybotrys chartarum (strain CBS 109288 / IBT 7711) TaxID=1280523 RepID=A0A084AL65_STACB|nr:hypothetical protein S7711_08820 [Stachybotrys chartarum IBT 7711]KFA55722.1 hypothetical protein S40293_08345 [Stachybotrys chartarum IBT 40293]
MSLPPDNASFFGSVATDSSSNFAFSSDSTPPTTVEDTASMGSVTSKHDVITVADDAADAAALISPPRSRRSQRTAPVYNLAQLSGTASHGKRRANGDIVSERRRRTISGDTLVGSVESASEVQDTLTRTAGKTVRQGIDALNLQWSPGRLNTPRATRRTRDSPRTARSSPRNTNKPISTLGTKLTNLSRRSRKAVDKGLKGAVRMSRELRRLQDTKEYAPTEETGVRYTVWSNGKYVDPKAPPEPPARKKAKTSIPEPEEEAEEASVPENKTRRVKKYLDKGLYAGQDAPTDIYKGLTPAEKKKLSEIPELLATSRANKIMPAPMYTGLRMLIAGGDFKLPFSIFNPLPPGQPKPDEWKKMTKNRFIGDSKDMWRKTYNHDYSKCVCDEDDGCGEDCQNRIMLYECDESNCNVGKERCTNRAFTDLTNRRSKGGKYQVGVEVVKTSDRGFGVRSNRSFEPHQIIMEYTGEIITLDECERRMNEIYKNNECYYLMSFDQNMILDATTGSMARFVNHSCNPNCRMIKWIVSGQPRMALFAGDRPIMTGDELTYDYNFSPFSSEKVQKCMCGEPNCRGVLGPKPREVKPPKTDIKTIVKATVKRKFKEVVGDGASASGSKAKKRKIQPATGVKRSLSTTSAKAAKGAATALKKGVSTITVNAKKVTSQAKSPARGKSLVDARAKKITKAAISTTRITKTYGKAVSKKHVLSKSSSLTIVAKGDGASAKKSGKQTPVKRLSKGSNLAPPADGGSRRTTTSKPASPRKALEISRAANQIRVVTSP